MSPVSFAAVASALGFAEPVSSLSHIVGAVIFLGAGVLLMTRTRGTRPETLISIAVFTFATVLLLAVSATYHFSRPGAARQVLQQLDFAAIHALLAATITLTYGVLFRGRGRWLPLSLVWLAAFSTFALSVLFARDVMTGSRTASLMILGLMALPSWLVLWQRAGFCCVRPLILGGLTYAVGGFMLAIPWLRPLPGIVEGHEVWHLFGLFGLAFHWRFAFRLVPIPPSAWLQPATPTVGSMPLRPASPRGQRAGVRPRLSAEPARAIMPAAVSRPIGATQHDLSR